MIASSLLGQLQRAFRSTPGVAVRVKQEPMEDPPPVEDQEETLVGGHNGEHNEEEEEDDVVTNEEVANHNGSEGQSPGEDDGFLFEIRFEGREGFSRSIHLEDLLEPTFEALMIEIQDMGQDIGGEDGGDYILFRRGTGKHSARIWQIGSTRELHHALKDYKSEGFVSIDVKAKRPALKTPPVAVTPAPKAPQKRKAPSGAAAKPQKKKPKPATPRALAAVPNPATPLKSTAAVASLSVAASHPSTTGSGRPKKPSIKQKEAIESARLTNDSIFESSFPDPDSSLADGDTSSSSFAEENADNESDDEDVPVTVSNKKGSVQEKICNAILELTALNITEPPRTFVALFAGYSHIRSKGFSNALSKLKTEGTVYYPSSKTVCLSQAGVASLPPRNPPKDNAAVQRRLGALIKGQKGKEMLEALSDGKVMLRAKLLVKTGYTHPRSKGFSNALSALSGLGLVTYPDTKTVALADICFPYGRPNT